MPQLIILMGVLSIANFAFFNYGVDVYEEARMDEEGGGVVEVYEVSEATEVTEEATEEEPAPEQ